MEPLLVMLAEWWWIGPAAAGAGTLGWVGVRASQRRLTLPAGRSTTARVARAAQTRPLGKNAARRLELDAATLDLQMTRQAIVRGRAEVKAAEAEVVRAQADAAAARTGTSTVAAARRRLQDAQRELRATAAEVRARRAGVRAAKAMLPAIRTGTAPLPVARLLAEHDAVLARWMQYETDPALAIAHPEMTDARSPLLAEFLRAHEHAQWLRPASVTVRLTPRDFLAYRDAVRRVSHTFAHAEGVARGRRPHDAAGPTPDAWSQVASDLAETAQRALARSMESMGRVAAEKWQERSTRRGKKATPDATPSASTPEDPVWPVPGRDRPEPPTT
ncbi:hypothetical protein ACFWZW_08750 [Microbacterium enclense]|uniref:hypothetical protein n=1 Tax=Microbacterium enclense TaxID=993073 RepID=UPI0036D84358